MLTHDIKYGDDNKSFAEKTKEFFNRKYKDAKKHGVVFTGGAK